MPFLDQPTPDLAAPVQGIPDTVTTPANTQAEDEANSVNNTRVWGSAFRQYNTIGSLLADKVGGDTQPLTHEPGFNAWDKIKGTKYEGNWNSFKDVFNSHDLAARQVQIDQETGDRKVLSQSGLAGTIAGVAAGVLDPTMLIPIAGEVQGIRTGAKVAAAALKTGASVGGAVALQEGALQGTQQLRTPEESAVVIGSSILLGGFLGGAAGMLAPAERATATAALDRLRAPQPIPGRVSDAGAAAAETATREGLTIEGRAAQAVANTTSELNPTLRLNTSPSVQSRLVGQQLGENSIYQVDASAGRTVGPSAERFMRDEMNSKLYAAKSAHDQIFDDGAKAGFGMNRAEFEDAVGQAMRRNDQGPNDFVTKAAESWRSQLFDPFKQQAIAEKLLPEDVSVTEADSYFRRMWNTTRLNAEEGRFKQIGVDHFNGVLGNEYAGDVERLQSRVAKLEQEKTDLGLPAAQRTQTLKDLEAEQQQLYGNAPEHVDRADKIADLRQQVIDANKAKNPAATKAAQEQAAALRKEGGDAFDAFVKKRADLNNRMRNVALNYAGIAEKRDTIANSLADLADATRRSMERLVKKGQSFERERQRLDPEKAAARVSDLRESFAAEATKAERQAERFKAQADKLKERQKETGQSQGAESAALLEAQAKAEQARADHLNAIADRLETAEALDPQAAIDEVRNGVDSLIANATDTTLARGEKAQLLQERMAKLDPAKVDDRLKTINRMKRDYERQHFDKWEIERGADLTNEKAPDFSQYSKDIMDAVHDRLTGRGFDNNIPDHLVPATRGPLKERTFHIPDRLVEDFLHDNIIHVAHDYARKMSSEIELTRRFGSADMKTPLAKVQEEYKGLRQAVEGAQSIDEIRAITGKDPGMIAGILEKMKEPTTEGVKAKALAYLTKHETSDMTDLQAMRDLLRGNYKRANMSNIWGRSARGLLAFNYITKLGTVVLSNISEVFRPAMVFGMGSFMKEGVAPLLSEAGRAAAGLAVHEARLAGQVVEKVLLHRVASFSEMGDPFAHGSAIERLLDNGSKLASRWNGLSAWTDGMKAVSSILAQNRIINLLKTGAENRTLAYLGMDANMRARVADMTKQFSEQQEGVWIANTEKWTDAGAIRAYRAALSKDVDSVIVTKGVGDAPLFTNTPTGKIIAQFKAFALASHQRVLIKGLQESPTRFMSGMASMTAMGMLATWLRAFATNRLDKVSQDKNPGWWIGEGLDSTGIFSVPMEFANDLEKATSVNPLKDPIRAAGAAITGTGMGPQSLRFQSRGKFGALLGPTIGMGDDLFSILGALSAHATGQKVSPSQDAAAIDAGARLTPFYSYPGLRQIIDYGAKPALHHAVGAN